MARASAPPWDSELPHRCRESCSFSFAEREEPPRDILPQEFTHLRGPNFCWVNRLLVIQDAVFWDVSGVFLRFRQRTDPLVIIELLRGWVFLFLQEQQLRVEEEAALFRQVSRRPTNCENFVPRNKRLQYPAPAKETMTSECSCRSPVGPRALIGRHFDVRERRPYLFCCGVGPSLRPVPLCTFHHSRQSSSPRHFPQWWDECQCLSSVG